MAICSMQGPDGKEALVCSILLVLLRLKYIGKIPFLLQKVRFSIQLSAINSTDGDGDGAFALCDNRT